MTGNPEHSSVQGDADFVTHSAKEAEEKNTQAAWLALSHET